MASPRTFGIYSYLSIGGALFGGAALIAALLGDRRGFVWWPLSRIGSSGMLSVCGVTKLVVEGFDKVPERQGALLMANHESLFDPAVLMKPSKVPLRFVAKHTLAYVPIFGQALWAMGHVFVRRGSGDSAKRSLERAGRAIADGKAILVFPEGTRTSTGELGRFKTGAFALAREAGVPIYPVGLAGTRAIMPKGKGFQRAGPVAVVVGDPIDPNEHADEPIEALVDAARSAVIEARARAKELCVR